MKNLLTYIFCNIAQKERAKIDEADSNPNKWYELFITYEDGGTQTLEKTETFAGIIVNVEKYVVEYKFDNVNIDIWENNNDKPQNIYTFFTTPLIYELIHDYFRYQNKLKNMRFVGEIIFPEDGSAPQFKKAYYNYGEEAEIFINEIAFEYFNNLCCYIPDMGSEDDEPDWCTCGDFLYTANDNKEIARRLFDEVTWEYPSTLYDQWECHGTLDAIEEKRLRILLDSLVHKRFGTLDEIKENVSKLLCLPVKSLEIDDITNHDDKSTNFVQADFSMTLDMETDSEDVYAMATLFYLKDRQYNYLITETSFTFE